MPGGAALGRADRDRPSGLDTRLARVEVVVASDVTNPLTGPAGAAATYGPQKGADPDAVRGARRGARQLRQRRSSGHRAGWWPSCRVRAPRAEPTAALLGFTNATLRPGVEVVAEMVGLADALEKADLVITGEGRADEQTLAGKAAMGVAVLAREAREPRRAAVRVTGAGRRRHWSCPGSSR